MEARFDGSMRRAAVALGASDGYSRTYATTMDEFPRASVRSAFLPWAEGEGSYGLGQNGQPGTNLTHVLSYILYRRSSMARLLVLHHGFACAISA